MALKFRRGTAAQKSGSLAFGEPYVNTTLGALQVGLESGDITIRSVDSSSAVAITSVSASTFLSASSLKVTGDASIDGNLTLGGTITIGDTNTDNVVVNADLSSSIIPNNDNAFDLGSTSRRYKNIYGVSLEATNITASAQIVNGDLKISSTSPRIYLIDTDNNDDFSIINSDGTFTIYDDTTSTGKFKIYTTGLTEINGATSIINGGLLVASGITGSIAATNGVVSGSSQITLLLPTGTVSGSSQVTISSTTGYTTFSSSVSSSLGAVSASITSTDVSQSNRLGNLELTSASVLGHIADINVKTGSFETKNATLATYTASIDSKFTTLQTLTASMTAQVSRIQESTASLNSFSASTLGHITDINTKTGSFESKFTTLQTLTASVAAQISRLQESSASLNAFTNSFNTAIQLTGSNVNIAGNLVVAGTQTTVNSSTLAIADSVIELNYGGAVVRSGILTKDGTGGSTLSGSLLWDATLDTWVAGISGSEAKVITDAHTPVTSSAQVVGILASLNAYSASQDTKNTTLASYTASVDAKFTTIGSVTASLNTFSASTLGHITDINTKTGSFETKFSTLQTLTASISAQISRIQESTASLNTFSASTLGHIADINSKTGSYAVINSTNTFTNNQTISGSIYVNSPNVTTGQFIGNQNGYAEFSIRNTSTGLSASGDIAVYADNGTATTNYIDMGINNSGLTSSYFYGGLDLGDALDAYVFSTGKDLRIGNGVAGQNLYLFNSATGKPVLTINPQQSVDITGSLSVSGSLVVSGAIIPATSGAYDLGTTTKPFRHIYVGTGSIYLMNPEGTAVHTINSQTIVTTNTLSSGSVDLTKSLPVGTVSASAQVVGILASTNAYTASQDSKNTTLASYTASLETKNATLATYTASLETKNATLATYTASVSGHISDINTKTGSFETKNATLAIYTASVDSKFTTLQTLTASMTAQVSRIQESTASLNAYTASQDTKNTTLASYTASLETKNATLATYTASLETKNATLASYTASNDTKWSTLGSLSGSFARTNSANIFTGNQTITGSLYISQDLVVQGSSSIQNISSSNLVIGAAYVTLNTNSPSSRYAGLQIVDSGSAGSSGSFLYDALHDEFIFVHKGNGTNVTSSHFVMGPETYDNLGNEIYMTTNRIPKVLNYEHIGDSQISDDGTTVSIPGALTVTGNITGPIRATNGVVSGSSQIVGSSITTNTVTVGSTAIALGGTATTIAGLSSVTSTGFTGALTGNASTATTLQTARTINGTSFNGSADITIPNLVSGSAQIAFSGVTGTVSNAQLANSAITIAGQSTSLGGTVTAETIRTAIGTVVTGSSQIDHNATTNYSANRHIDHTAVSISAGSGLTGGGDISATRTLSIANLGVTDAMLAGSISNAKLTNSSITIAGQSTALGGTVTAETIRTSIGTVVTGSAQITGIGNAQLTNSSVTVTAGTGMSGGGAVSLGGSVTLTNAGVTSNVAGTGVTVSGATGAVTISIGQAVATSSNVQFNSLGVGMAASATAGRIDASGDIVAYSTSDRNFKENIIPIPNALEKISKISGNTYDWKEDMKEYHGFEGNDVGVIAQEIEAVLPQLVTTRETGYKAVKYDKLVALLIEGIKEQQQQINSLTLQVENLKKQNGL